jgi:hypothetical protein
LVSLPTFAPILEHSRRQRILNREGLKTVPPFSGEWNQHKERTIPLKGMLRHMKDSQSLLDNSPLTHVHRYAPLCIQYRSPPMQELDTARPTVWMTSVVFVQGPTKRQNAGWISRPPE